MRVASHQIRAAKNSDIFAKFLSLCLIRHFAGSVSTHLHEIDFLICRDFAPSARQPARQTAACPSASLPPTFEWRLKKFGIQKSNVPWKMSIVKRSLIYCGAVDRAVVSDTRDPRFESSHRQFNLPSTVLNKLTKFKCRWPVTFVISKNTNYV